MPQDHFLFAVADSIDTMVIKWSPGICPCNLSLPHATIAPVSRTGLLILVILIQKHIHVCLSVPCGWTSWMKASTSLVSSQYFPPTPSHHCPLLISFWDPGPLHCQNHMSTWIRCLDNTEETLFLVYDPDLLQFSPPFLSATIMLLYKPWLYFHQTPLLLQHFYGTRSFSNDIHW